MTSSKHGVAPVGAPGILKTDEFLKENHDFHFCVLSAPNALSKPQKAFPRRPKALRHYSQPFSAGPGNLSEPFSDPKSKFLSIFRPPFALILDAH